MTLQKKINFIFTIIFLFGLLFAGYISYTTELHHAREEVLQNAEFMLESAIATRSYTANQIRPLLLDQLDEKFLPQTVPSYAAQQTFLKLRKKFPEYTYREAALNPTNTSDRATAWEVGIIQDFRNNPDLERRIRIRGLGFRIGFWILDSADSGSYHANRLTL